MKTLLKRITCFFFPDRNKRAVFCLFFLLFFFKIIWFDLSWSFSSTFKSFSYAETYVFAILLSLSLSFPITIVKSKKIIWGIDLLLGFFLLANLIYFRTYYTAIPLSSYGLAGNMADFTDSIYNSLYWSDVLFPLSSVIALIVSRRLSKERNVENSKSKSALHLAILILIFVVAGNMLVLAKGGFKKAYESLQNAYTHVCGTPMYTVFGSLYYDYIRENETYSPETKKTIENWLEKQHDYQVVSELATNDTRTNCIIILAESLESWVLGCKVEGQEIMPNMNRLINDSTTLYAPYVLTQVKGGRSIDAQLLINTGLLPINTGAYSIKYPKTFYPSIAKAMKEKYGSLAYTCTLTPDKPMVWNESVISKAFGYDEIKSKQDFIQDEQVGPRYRPQLGDISLLRQCYNKINKREVWKNKVNLLQIITYAGHFPFNIPDDKKKVSFSDNIPPMMNDYMTVANYTDRALGEFVQRIKADPLYKNTLVVITGDHEGLVDMRKGLCTSKGGKGIVSEECFTPLIIANIPHWLRKKRKAALGDNSKGMRYEKVMGQVDIYPTLLQLLGLSDYTWRGLGQSILRTEKQGVAIDPHGEVHGDAKSIPDTEIAHLKGAWNVSDMMIRYNYLSVR